MRGGLITRVMVASAGLATIVGGAFVVLLLETSAEREREDQTRGSLEELAAVNDLERLLVDLETGIRGFVITHDDRFLQPWTKARAAFPTHAQALARLADDPVEHRLVRKIAAAVESYIGDYAAPLVDAARRRDPEAASVAATEEGRRRVDAVRADFEHYRSLEQAPLAQRRGRSDAAARRTAVAAAAGLVGSVLLIVIFVLYLSRAIVRPVRRAAAMAGRVAGGDLSARMPETATGEIGELEHSFNTMTRSLEANRDDLRLLAEEQASLRRVATLISRGASPIDIFDLVVIEVAQLLRANSTSLLRYEADDTATVVAASGANPVGMGVGARFKLEDQDLAATVSHTAPVVVEGQLWGVVLATWTQPEAATVEVQERMAQFSELVATAIANAESRAELTASRARVVAASDETRRRIERDLHDGTQQRLVSLGLQLRAAQATVPPELPELTGELSAVSEGLAAAVEDLQEVSRGIHPAILSRGGLVAALRTLARRAAVPVELDLRADRRLPEPIEVAAYYVVSEALTNTAKHARASVVYIDLEATDATIKLSIRDDGIGGADPNRGSGLVGLRDRIEALGGSIEVASPTERGTSLVVVIPLPPN